MIPLIISVLFALASHYIEYIPPHPPKKFRIFFKAVDVSVVLVALTPPNA